jgi:hypothetical protein
MKAINALTTLFSFLILISCSHRDLEPSQSSIEGAWRLYEVGYSPGSGYYVDTIPSSPLQSLTFFKTGEAHSQGDQLGGIFTLPYYRVTTLQDELKIKFLNPSKEENATSYMSLQIAKDSMIIRPSCREGCHYNFVRIR